MPESGASGFPSFRRIVATAGALLAAVPLSAATEGSAPSSGRVAPTVVLPEEAMAREASGPAAEPPRREAPGWWQRLSPSDRGLIAPRGYEDPMAILEAKRWHLRWAAEARAAQAEGGQLPVPPKPFDAPPGSAIVERDAPAPGSGGAPPPPGDDESSGPAGAPALDSFPTAPAGPGSPPAAPAAPTWHSSFAGLSTGWRPSDSAVAVGPAHVGAVVNSSLAFYRKDGTAAVGPLSFASWFPDAPLGGDLFDPKIVYDRWAGRWIVLVLNGRAANAENYYALSISQTNDPEGGWWNYYLRSDIDGGTDTNSWTDFPGLGFDSGDATASPSTGGAVYVTSNQYDRGGSGGFQRGKLRVLPKHQLFSGSAVGWWDFWNPTVFSWKPATTDSSTGASPVEYLANTLSGGGASLTVWTLTNPLAAGPTLASTNVSSSVYGVPPNGEQLGGSASSRLDTGDCRTQDVQYRAGHVWLTAGDYSFWGDPFDTDAVVHYWKIAMPAGTAAWDGYFGNDNEAFFFGKVQADPDANAHLVFSHSSPSTFARIGVTGRLAADGAVQSYSVVRTGSATYDIAGEDVERWGDYAGVGFDCAGDERGSWAMSQVATSAASWQTWLAGQSFAAPNVWHVADGSSIASSAAPRWFTWHVNSADWAGVALAPTAGGDEDLAASSTCPFGTPYQNSTVGGTARDFVVANGAQTGTAYHHARVTHYSGAAGYRLEARETSTDLAVGTAAASSFASTELLRLFEVPLVSGKGYAAVVDGSGGSADFSLAVFRGSRSSGRRLDNDGFANVGGIGAAGDETVVFTASESSRWGFAVLNENAGSSAFSFRVWLRPAIAAIGNATIAGGSSYTGPTPSLTEGTTPVTWSLDAPPAGMTIHPTTGVVSWTAPVTATVVTVTIRATNPAGYSTESWTLTVTGAPGRVPDGDAIAGTPLRAAEAGGDLTLTWGASCNAAATNYEVYEGALAAWTSHAAKSCSTGGATTATVTPAAGDRYFLVVPVASSSEGGYGFDSAGVERPRAAVPCLATQNASGCP